MIYHIQRLLEVYKYTYYISFHQVGVWYGLRFQLVPVHWNITFKTRTDDNIISYSALKMKPTFYKVSFQIFYQNEIKDYWGDSF